MIHLFSLNNAKILILISILGVSSWSQKITDFYSHFGMNPIETALANKQPAPNITGLQLDNARGMFMIIDSNTLTLDIMGMQKKSLCKDHKIAASKMTMTCTVDDKTDYMILSLKDGKLHVIKKKDSITLVFDKLTDLEFKSRQEKAIAALKIMTGM